jgi:hypothetical protein
MGMTDLKKFIPNWGTPAMLVNATELACTKCHNDMGAGYLPKKNHQITSHNQIATYYVRVVSKN